MKQKTLENADMVIINHYNSLDPKEKAQFRLRVFLDTEMSYASFYNKLRGVTRFTKSEASVILNIIGSNEL